MTTNKILLLTLLATTLTLNATVVQPQLQTTSKQQTNSVTNQIAKTLYRRGIDADKAQKISRNIIRTDEELFAYMLNTFSQDSSLELVDIYNELATMALHKKEVDFSSYSFLVKLTQKIKNRPLNTAQLQNIESIARKNQLILQAFV